MKTKFKKTTKIILLITVVYLFSINSLTYFPTNKEICANKLRSKVADTIAMKKNLSPIGFSGQMLNEIQKLGLTFQGYHEIKLEDARELIVYAVNTFLDEINSDEQIRPHLKFFPFTSKNIEIVIWLYKPDQSQVNNNDISCVVSREGTIKYYRGEKEFDPKKPILIESTKDAIEIVQRGKNSSIPPTGGLI